MTPMVAVTVILWAPAIGPVAAIAITQALPVVEAVLAHSGPPMTAGVPAVANEPAGQVMVTEPVGRGVARVKATVTGTLVAPGTLLPPVSAAKVT